MGLFADRWEHSPEAVAAGTLACTSRACGLDDLDAVELRAPSTVTVAGQARSIGPGVQEWDLDTPGWRVAVAPVLVCRQPGKTVGLGCVIPRRGVKPSWFC
jgi:hypothetical protein